ncbi:MAG TPA: hypothetical protein VF064_20190 [Pyrinomonadaceae bacterium]
MKGLRRHTHEGRRRVVEGLAPLVRGEYRDLPKLRETAERVFEEFEGIFEAPGVELYDESVDPNDDPPPRVRSG